MMIPSRAVVRLGLLSGQAGEVGQLRQRDVHAKRPRGAAPALDSRAEVGVERARLEHLEVEELRVDRPRDRARLDLGPVPECDAGDAAAFHAHRDHFGANADLDAAGARLLRHRLADCAHAAQRVSPGAALAVHFAERVVQKHVGRAGRIGAREMPDLGVEAERRLEGIGLEPPVEELARAFRDDLPQVALRAARKEGELPAQREGAQAAAPARAQIGRRLEDEAAQRVGSGFDGAVVVRQAPGVASREARELLLGVRGRRTELEISPVRERQEIRERPLDDLQAVIREPQVADHLRIEQAHRVRGGGIAETRREFLGDGRAADDRAALQHPDTEAGACQITRADQAVMTAADDDDVVGHGASGASRCGRRRDCRRSWQMSSQDGRRAARRARAPGCRGPSRTTRNRRS